MPTYISENKIVDRYLGDKFLKAAYIGDQKVYDPYAEITGYLPIIYKSRAAVALKNYRIYGMAEGAGVETENLFNADLVIPNSYYNNVGVLTPTEENLTASPLIPVENGETYIRSSQGAAVGNIYVVFDNDKNFLYRGSPSTAGLPITVESNGAYIGFTIDPDTTPLQSYMFTKGSTPPDHYIPHGYKLPLVVESGETENLWDLETWNNATAQRGTIERIGNSFKLTATSNDCYSRTYADSDYAYEVTPGGQYSLFWTVDNSSIAGQVYVFSGESIAGTSLKIVQTSAQSMTFIIPNNHHYISFRIGVANAGNSITYSNIMLTEGSTPPDHYIPHRYTSDIPIYIGFSKLGEEEYVDYGEQKVYKRTENLFTEEGSGLIQITATGIKRYGKDVGVLSAGTYTIDYTLLSHASVSLWLHTVKDNVYTSEQIVSHPYTFTLNEDKDVIFRTSSQQPDATWQTLGVVDIMLVSGSTAPSTYIPYLQPTDPPVPFPPIPTYKGENTLSSTEALGEATVKGRIRELNYKRLSYIKSSDGSAYIDTDITGLNAATDYIEAEMSFGTLDYIEDGVVLFGCATAYDGHWKLFGATCNGYEQDTSVRNNHFYSYVNYSTGGSGTIKRMRVVTNSDFSSKLLLSVKTPQSTIKNLETGTVYTPSVFDPNWDAASLQPIDFVQAASFTIFAGQYYRSAGDVVYYKSHRNTSCYGTRIYRNDVLIHNLIPVEREDGELGLLDTITNKFYTNAGTGTFEKGEYI